MTSADHPTRRDFLVVSSSAFAAVGSALAIWPFLNQMNPDAAVQALANIEVDLAPIPEGQAVTVLWRGKPVFIRHRTADEIAAAGDVSVWTLSDRSARNAALAETAEASDANRTKPGHPQWLVLVGVCTHLGCVPQGQKTMQKRGEFGGWFCSCHGSQYDTAGRIRKGPAPYNLEVPPYYFMSDSRITLGLVAPPTPPAGA